MIKDGQILAERYQYDRTAARSVRVALDGEVDRQHRRRDGACREQDRLARRHRRQICAGPCRQSLWRDHDPQHPADGVRRAFKEVYDGKDDNAKFNRIRLTQQLVTALRAFPTREVEQGTQFHYASNQTVVLTLLLRAVTGTNLSEYLTPRLWQPMGAEADATWIKTRDGTETGSGNFNAILRDFGRLGILLANDGAAGGKQIVPKDYLLDATDWHRQPEAFRPQKATPYFGYGYQFWLFPGEKRRFALLGVYGQSIFVDPELKLVLVITAAAKNASVGKEPFARERDALWRGIVGQYGSW